MDCFSIRVFTLAPSTRSMSSLNLFEIKCIIKQGVNSFNDLFTFSKQPKKLKRFCSYRQHRENIFQDKRLNIFLIFFMPYRV